MKNDTLPGGLSLFSMDFTYNGLSWAENICQKLEKICTDNAIIQNPGKYIDVVGEHFRKVLDDVTGDWINPSDGCGEEQVVDLSLKDGLFSEVCKKSKVALNEKPLDENPLYCIRLESMFSSVEGLNSATSSNVSQGLSHACDEHGEKLISISTEVIVSNHPDGMGEGSMDVPDSVASLADVTGQFPSADKVLPSESDENEVMGRELVLSECASSQKIYAVTESSDSFHRGKMPDIPIMVDQDVGFIEEFEDVKLEECWDDPVNVEVAFIKNRARWNKSYKKKLKNAIISKVRSMKGYDGTDLRLQGAQVVALSASYDDLHPCLSANEPCDSDWELL